jgi:hypothetical protein
MVETNQGSIAPLPLLFNWWKGIEEHEDYIVSHLLLWE